jgi:hypothetical protein
VAENTSRYGFGHPRCNMRKECPSNIFTVGFFIVVIFFIIYIFTVVTVVLSVVFSNNSVEVSLTSGEKANPKTII